MLHLSTVPIQAEGIIIETIKSRLASLNNPTMRYVVWVVLVWQAQSEGWTLDVSDPEVHHLELKNGNERIVARYHLTSCRIDVSYHF